MVNTVNIRCWRGGEDELDSRVYSICGIRSWCVVEGEKRQTNILF